MRLYLDDDCVQTLLVRLLRAAGHDVRLPADVGLAGADDAVHLTRAISEDRVVLTRNYRDFSILHNLLIQAQGQHPGILVVRRGADTQHAVTPRDIVRAIGNLESAGVPIADQYIILNAWQ
jgi:predicted nuclease of predicted toxin-antitoxin system